MVSYKSLIHIAAFITSFALADDKCNPLHATCSPVPALGGDISDSFNSESPNYSIMAYPDGVHYTSSGLELTLAKRFDNPSIQSNFYIMFGRTEVHLKAAKGTGIVSSFYLQSDDLDEIDLEFFGTDTTQVQSNWFTKGDTTTYDRGGYHNTPAPPQDDFHNYTVDWTKDYVNWWVDSVLVRTLTPDNPQGFPQSPMKLFAGIWAGGDPSNTKYTIEWAGGATDYSQAPFTMAINKLIVSDYSTGKTYSYGDQSGSWQSIKSDGGSVNSRLGAANLSPNGEQAAVSISSSSETSSSATTASTSSSATTALTSSSATTDLTSSSATAALTSSSTTTALTSSSTSVEISSTTHISEISSTTAASATSSSASVVSETSSLTAQTTASESSAASAESSVASSSATVTLAASSSVISESSVEPSSSVESSAVSAVSSVEVSASTHSSEKSSSVAISELPIHATTPGSVSNTSASPTTLVSSTSAASGISGTQAPIRESSSSSSTIHSVPSSVSDSASNQKVNVFLAALCILAYHLF